MSGLNISPRSHEEHEAVTKIAFDDISRQVVDAAYKVHQSLGSGLLEGLYEECMAVELEKINPAHQAQILSYMKTSGVKTGLLINFGEPYFKAAIKRFVL